MKRSLFFTILLLAGCGRSPFPGDKLVQVRQPNPTAAGFTLAFEEVMEFREGELAEYTVTPTVPAPGTPKVSAAGLPEGAAFDGGKVSWNPSPGAGINPADPSAHYREYRITLTLSSSLDDSVSIQRSAVLLVHEATHNLRGTSSEAPCALVYRINGQSHEKGGRP